MTPTNTVRPGRLPWLIGVLLLAPAILVAQPVRVGENKAYEAASQDLASAAEAGLTVEEEGASFIWLHFSLVNLPGNSRIVVRGGDGQVAVLTADEVENGEAWSDPIDGDSVLVTSPIAPE